MKQHIQHGDLIESITPFDDSPNIIVHGTNCIGYMNSGFARALRDLYPGVYEVFKKEHDTHGLQLGHITTYQLGSLTIVNANTQQYCRNYRHPDGTVEPQDKVFVDYDAVQEAFQRIAALANVTGAHIHYPLIGAGLANGNWNEIDRRISMVLDDTYLQHTLWIKE